MGEPVLLVEDQDSVRILTMNRPGKRNALNTTLTCELRDALRQAAGDESVLAVVLTGAGAAFCSGADIGEFAELTPEAQRGVLARADLTVSVQSMLQEMPKPIVSAVQGPALGGGAGLAIGCDMMIAATDLQLGYPEVRHALVPATVMTGLQRQIGRKLAFEMVSTGRILSATEAMGAGLVNRVVAPEQVLAAAVDVAERWSQFNPAAVAAIKSLFYRVGDLSFTHAMQAGRDTNVIMRGFPRK